ncbi:IS30 family transposase [Arthrobacter sp. OAP107]
MTRLGTVAKAAKELGLNRSTCQKWANAAGIRRKRQYTQADKDQFHAVLDRTGNIAGAARELGLNTSTANTWAGRINPAPTKPSTNRSVNAGPAQRYSQAVIEEFLGVLRDVGSVSVAARQLGLNHSTCSNWATDAGLVSVSPQRPSEKQLHYLRLRQQGVNRRDAARAVGASKPSSYHWDRKHAAGPSDTAAPDGHTPDLPYKQEVKTTCADPLATATAPELTTAAAAPVPLPVALEALEQPISARYLSLPERERIADQLAKGGSIRAIARDLGRNQGSISREIKRNSHPVLGYLPYGAHRAATAARARPKASKLAEPGKLHDYVKTKLLTRWSPQQISRSLIKEFPDDPVMRVSHETIYQALYLQARGGLKREVKEALRTGRTRRKQHKNPEERTSRFRDPMINISERPAEIEDRAVPGHWESQCFCQAA